MIGDKGGKGETGERCSLWYYGNNDPISSGIYNAQDAWLNVTTYDVFVYSGTEWKLNGNLKGGKGDQGDTGTDGTQILTSTVDPSQKEAAENLLWLNTATGDLFETVPVGDDQYTWSKIGSLKGAKGDTGATGDTGKTGDTGATGADGKQGKRGSIWFFGSDNPTSGDIYIGGDCFLNTTTYDCFINNGTNWQENGNLKGAKGDAGDVGATGATGATGKAATVQIGDVANGINASVVNRGNENAALLDFVLPKGEKGDSGSRWYSGEDIPDASTSVQDERGAPRPGDMYLQLATSEYEAKTYIKLENGEWSKPLGTVVGVEGKPASITVGSFVTGDPGTNVIIENVGTTSDVVLNFTIPKGDKGDTGAQGLQGDSIYIKSLSIKSDDLPGTPVFKGAKGQLSTTTEVSVDGSGVENTYSETLFSIEFLKKACPKAGDAILSMDSAYGVGNHIALAGGIVKQTKGGTKSNPATQVYHIDFMNQYDTVLDTQNGGCGVVYFDGTDFKSKPYTMKADLQLKYSFLPIGAQLDGEYILDVDTYAAQAHHNAYIVYPVAKGPGKGKGVIRPGTIFDVTGNASVSGVYEKNKGDWSVRYVTAVVKNNTCQVAFKNITKGQDLSKKFQTQDHAGIGANPNPTAVLWPTSTIISDFTLVGNGRDSVVGNAKGNSNLPVHVEDGDCVVQAMLPLGKSSTTPGTNVNVESQVGITYIPD